jgi:hypothetical protein
MGCRWVTARAVGQMFCQAYFLVAMYVGIQSKCLFFPNRGVTILCSCAGKNVQKNMRKKVKMG